MAAARNEVTVNVPALTPELKRNVEERIREFERDHDDEVVRGGPGWVSRISPADYVVAVIVNVILLVWMVVAFVA